MGTLNMDIERVFELNPNGGSERKTFLWGGFSIYAIGDNGVLIFCLEFFFLEVVSSSFSNNQVKYLQLLSYCTPFSFIIHGSIAVVPADVFGQHSSLSNVVGQNESWGKILKFVRSNSD